MAILKWSIESILTAVAMTASTIGGIYVTSYHFGTVNQQIIELQTKTAQTESHLSKHDDQLTDIKQQNAGIVQSLDDIKDTVHDIQNQVRQHGNNK
jgi:peptidoglycan hydrolase CwlO-like protein